MSNPESKHSDKKSKIKRYNKRLNSLGNLAYPGGFNIPTSIELVQYNTKQYSAKKLTGDLKIHDHLSPEFTSWFRITGMTDVQTISAICSECGIERFDIRNLFSGQQVTKIVTYKKSNFALMSGCFIDDEGDLQTEQIAFIVGQNYVISIQESATLYFEEVFHLLKNPQSQVRLKTADFLFCVLLNNFQGILSNSVYTLIDKISETEDLLIDGSSEKLNIMDQVRRGRANYLTMRRIVAPLREELVNILHNPNGLILAENIMYFNDFDDKLRAVISDLEIYNETFRSVLDIYYSNNNQRMNDIIKRLTIVSTIFIPLTFIVGVWGMNFRFMPELNWKYGYFLAWGIIFLITLILVWLLKKKKWF